MLHQADAAPPKHASQKTEGHVLLDPEITATCYHPTVVLTEQPLTNLHKAAELAHPNHLSCASWGTHTGCNTQALAPTITTVKPAAFQAAEKAKWTGLAQGLAAHLRRNTCG